ncbi:Uncharacterised protein [Legionella oakridgensis]|uniref:Uncharacterized protein n=1 Tax=Legionella longbeachae serogroup 1 (strain NSW150) TaxID=661367 RepID=D3HJL2_LEGLN|nr:hypothetical protein LLO_2202 [Legionella longbeachae NSW150]VEE03140.1 Uncharacterised protein [Legionella oakridgensis]
MGGLGIKAVGKAKGVLGKAFRGQGEVSAQGNNRSAAQDATKDSGSGS